MNMKPLTKTLIFVGIFNLVVLAIVFVLFKYLDSQATVEGTDMGFGKWQAGGAIAGFIIITFVNLYLLKRFSPKDVEAHSSYPAIRDFYNEIQEKDYKKAWELISPEYQKSPKWNGDIDKFLDGFQKTQGVNLLAINFVSSQNPYSDEYVVYYQDKTNAPVIPGLEELGEWEVRRLPELNDKVTALRNLLGEKGIKIAALDNMKIHQLITAIRGDILRWNIMKSSEEKKADDLLPTSKPVYRLTGKQVTVRLINKKWLIDNVEDIPYNKEE